MPLVAPKDARDRTADNPGVADLAQALTDATAKATYRAAGFGQ